IDCSNFNDQAWELTLAYEDIDECKFTIIGTLEFDCQAADDSEKTISNVVVKRIEEGQDGPVIFQKFSIKPSAEKSMQVIDTLKLYTKEKYKMSITGAKAGASLAVSTEDIIFFKSECYTTYFFAENISLNHYANCGTNTDRETRGLYNSCTTIYKFSMDDIFYGGSAVWYSKKGWRRDSDRKKIAEF
ncbi:hypothetical protein PFISCL1PPCAC_17286, partial [Pristionchus fissidentatus]